tara:strand:- start:2508 stop:2768 length:261 start_codon:yes stop_codon:yes gene_type:complete
MIDKNSKKYLQFEKRWNGVTPKGTNISKKNSFRSLMKNNCQQEGFEFSKVNSYLIYSGEYKNLDDDTLVKNDIKLTRPPRRHLRKF